MTKEFTQTHSRFQVLNRFGFVQAYQSFNEALERIRNCTVEEWPLSIYDTMAMKGKPQTWNLLPDYTLKVVEIKK